MTDALRKQNCKTDVPGIAKDWDNWLQDHLWKGKSWLSEASSLITKAIPGFPYPAAGTPPQPLFGNVNSERELKAGLTIACDALVAYARAMTGAVEQAHAKYVPLLPAHDRRRHLLNVYLYFLKLERDSIARPNPSTTNPARICGVFAGWARRFNRWGIVLHLWENTLAPLVPRDDTMNVLQVPPPPWPPWPDFDDDAPDALISSFEENSTDEPTVRSEVY